MPLHADAKKSIFNNLVKIHSGRRAKPVFIGCLTDIQLAELNEERAGRGFKPMNCEVVFVGQHIYDKRVCVDRYSFNDVIAQIESVMLETAIFRVSPKMNGLVSIVEREDGYGNCVTDEGVLECSMRFPRPELYSVIPKGDDTKPPKK